MTEDETPDFYANRPPRDESPQFDLFEIEPDWKDEWWSMPEFDQRDCRPQRSINVNFMNDEAVREFCELIGVRYSDRIDSTYFPPQNPLKGEYEWGGPKIDTRYPICIPSKGRADVQTTGKRLDEMGISYNFFVEEHEADWYRENVGEDSVVAMPFRDLGQGSIPARNFLWEWAKEREFDRHWCLDDNIISFGRTHMNRRLNARSGGLFRAMEDFVDRYENIAMAGPHSRGFVPDRDPRVAPYHLNSRVYSCILIDTNQPERWRGRYNEDTDLSLRFLKRGLCTVLFRSMIMQKAVTVGAVGTAMKGGNTDNVYNTGDHREAFADSLVSQHPDVVKKTWKFGRWHHEVDYSGFKQKLVLKPGVTKTKTHDNYGMKLVRVKNQDPEKRPQEEPDPFLAAIQADSEEGSGE